MVKKENSLQKQCTNWLDTKKIYYINTWGNAFERRGRPDLYICWKGRFVACELKIEGKEPTLLQYKHLREIEASGGEGIWATSLEDMIFKLCQIS